MGPHGRRRTTSGWIPRRTPYRARTLAGSRKARQRTGKVSSALVVSKPKSPPRTVLDRTITYPITNPRGPCHCLTVWCALSAILGLLSRNISIGQWGHGGSRCEFESVSRKRGTSWVGGGGGGGLSPGKAVGSLDVIPNAFANSYCKNCSYIE